MGLGDRGAELLRIDEERESGARAGLVVRDEVAAAAYAPGPGVQVVGLGKRGAVLNVALGWCLANASLGTGLELIGDDDRATIGLDDRPTTTAQSPPLPGTTSSERSADPNRADGIRFSTGAAFVYAPGPGAAGVSLVTPSGANSPPDARRARDKFELCGRYPSTFFGLSASCLLAFSATSSRSNLGVLPNVLTVRCNSLCRETLLSVRRRLPRSPLLSVLKLRTSPPEEGDGMRGAGAESEGAAD